MTQVFDAVINNIFNKNNPAFQKEVYCEICKISLSSMVVLNEHRQGKKHKRALQLLRGKLKNLKCDMCSVDSKDLNEYELHVTSSLHVEKAKLLGYLNPPAIPTNATQPLLSQEIVEIITTSEATPLPVSTPAQPQPQPVAPPPAITQQQPPVSGVPKKKIPNPNELIKCLQNSKKLMSQTTYTCSSCNIQVTSKANYQAHLLSKRHRKNKHKFHVYPGISKETVKEKYQNNFVRAGTLGNEFTDKNVIFYCKKCDCKMQSKLQLEIHMSSNWHKENVQAAESHQEPSILKVPNQPAPGIHPPQNQQLFNFDNSAYGYGYRNWNAESHIYEVQKQIQEQQKQPPPTVVATKPQVSASNYYSFPFYAYNQQASTQISVPAPPVPPPLPIPPPSMLENMESMITPQPVQPPLPNSAPPLSTDTYDFTSNDFMI